MERSEPIGAEQDNDSESVLSLEQFLHSPNQTSKELYTIYTI